MTRNPRAPELRSTERPSGSTPAFDVATFYRFQPVAAPEELREQIDSLCAGVPETAELCGTVLIATEGLNATLAARRGAGLATLAEQITALLDDPPLVKWSVADEAPFRRLRVRVKNEIVTLRSDEVAPSERTAREAGAAEWRRLIAREDVLLVDVRNDYEIEAGRFEGAVDPSTDSFTEFVDWIDRELEGDPQRPVAMYCTGGIRCEKVSSLLLARGHDQVTQLRGGVLGYFEEVRDAQLPTGDSEPWQGECFVFDGRTTVTPRLEPGDAEMCRRCGWPVSAEQRAAPGYDAALGCAHCRVAERLESGGGSSGEEVGEPSCAEVSGPGG